jgi:hypothetical protein
MRALHDAGRSAEALAAYENCREVLADALGVNPGSRLRVLHQRILVDETAPARSVVIPRQLPPEVPHFVGRDRELSLLDKAFRSPMIIEGAPGAGRSALAVRWARSRRDAFTDGELYLDLNGLSAREALEILLGGLRLPGRLPDDVESRSALFRSALAGRRMLVLLDNALSAEQVRPLLPGGRNAVLITSSALLPGLVARDGAERLSLAPLAESEASTLLFELIGTRRCMAEPKAVAELATLCSGLPLALRVAAEYASRLELTECVTALRDELVSFEPRRYHARATRPRQAEFQQGQRETAGRNTWTQEWAGTS